LQPGTHWRVVGLKWSRGSAASSQHYSSL
jgi:hypothetical protein